MAWQTMDNAIAKLKMRYTLYNNIRANLVELKSKIETEHNSDGTHDFVTMTNKGPKAWCAFQGGDPLIFLPQRSFRALSVYKLYTGVYPIIFDVDATYPAHMSFNISLMPGALATRVLAQKTSGGGYPVAVEIRDSTGAFTDLTSDQMCVAVLWGDQ